MALLVVDIGNSRVKAALFSKTGEAQPISLRRPRELSAWASHSIAYVDTRLSPQWRESLHAAGATELTSDLGLPFPTRYSPHLGPDRAAQLVAAWYAQQFPAVVLS